MERRKGQQKSNGKNERLLWAAAARNTEQEMSIASLKQNLAAFKLNAAKVSEANGDSGDKE